MGRRCPPYGTPAALAKLNSPIFPAAGPKTADESLNSTETHAPLYRLRTSPTSASSPKTNLTASPLLLSAKL